MFSWCEWVPDNWNCRIKLDIKCLWLHEVSNFFKFLRGIIVLDSYVLNDLILLDKMLLLHFFHPLVVFTEPSFFSSHLFINTWGPNKNAYLHQPLKLVRFLHLIYIKPICTWIMLTSANLRILAITDIFQSTTGCQDYDWQLTNIIWNLKQCCY